MMWLQNTSQVCKLLSLSIVCIVFVQIVLICAQSVGYVSASYVSPNNKYSQRNVMSTNEDPNRNEAYKSSNHRLRNQQQEQNETEDDADDDDDDDDEESTNNFDVKNNDNFNKETNQHNRNAKLQNAQNSRRPTTRKEQDLHKCRFWVPIEAVDKYKGARDLQVKDDIRQLKEIEVCCKGFDPVRWMGNTICDPHCDSCRNGFCKGPNDCECYEHFVKNDNGDCVFTCPLGCLNGRCYLDGTCQCNPGYKLDETRKFCRPICSVGCDLVAGQNCTEPEVCACAKGFQLKSDGCKPVCDPDCGIGGVCKELNTCECDPGYTVKDGVCQSECYQSCDNGLCVSQNRCICNPNYQYHERSTMCIPI